MNRKRIITTSLVGSIGLTVLSLSLSFAWYNSSENLYLDTLSINVSSSRDLMIATVPDETKLVTSLKYMMDPLDPNENSLENKNPFKPVSTMFKSKWIDEKKQDPVFYEYSSAILNDEYEPTPSVVDSSWGYYSQHLWLYCDRDTKVTLDSTTFNVNPVQKSNEAHAEQLLHSVYILDQYINKPNPAHPEETAAPYTWSEDEMREDLVNNMNNLVNCMRVGILDPDLESYKFTIVDPKKNGETELGGREDLFLSGYYDSYSKLNEHSDFEWYEILYGEIKNRDKAVYKDALPEQYPAPGQLEGEASSFNAYTKENVHAFDKEASEANGLEIVKEDSLSLDEVEDKFQVSLKAGKLKEIVLSIYMEGWDLDCVNSHMGGSFGMDLQFKVAEMNDQIV